MAGEKRVVLFGCGIAMALWVFLLLMGAVFGGGVGLGWLLGSNAR